MGFAQFSAEILTRQRFEIAAVATLLPAIGGLKVCQRLFLLAMGVGGLKER